jgi:hypothetical protein
MQERPGSYGGPERGDGGKRGEKAQIIFSFRHKLAQQQQRGRTSYSIFWTSIWPSLSLWNVFEKKALKRICRPWLTGSDTRVHKNSLHKVNFLFQEILRADEKLREQDNNNNRKKGIDGLCDRAEKRGGITWQ